jgi:hypothetical protein
VDKLIHVDDTPVIQNDVGNIEADNSGFEYTTRCATSADAESICRLFKKVFKEEMTPAHWRWKYTRDLSRAIVVYRDKQLVAHYGGVGTNILLEGKTSTAIQVTDLMVDPQARNAVRSNSPFYLSAKKFLESFVGFEKPFLLGYGFPSGRAMDLSEKLGLFTPVGTMWEARWSVKQEQHVDVKNCLTLDKNNFQSYEKKINSLWHKFSHHFSNHFICNKNADYFKWRFLEHPSKQYSIHLAMGRITKLPKALFVLRHDDNKKSMLMDVLGRSLGLEEILKLAIVISAQKGSNKLITWHSDNFKKTFSVLSPEQEPLAIKIPANIGSVGPDPESQKNKWWFMPGDTDYL